MPRRPPEASGARRRRSMMNAVPPERSIVAFLCPQASRRGSRPACDGLPASPPAPPRTAARSSEPLRTLAHSMAFRTHLVLLLSMASRSMTCASGSCAASPPSPQQRSSGRSSCCRMGWSNARLPPPPPCTVGAPRPHRTSQRATGAQWPRQFGSVRLRGHACTLTERRSPPICWRSLKHPSAALPLEMIAGTAPGRVRKAPVLVDIACRAQRRASMAKPWEAHQTSHSAETECEKSVTSREP